MLLKKLSKALISLVTVSLVTATSFSANAADKSCHFVFYNQTFSDGEKINPYVQTYKNGARATLFLNSKCDETPRCDENPTPVTIACNNGVLTDVDSGKVITDTHNYFQMCHECSGTTCRQSCSGTTPTGTSGKDCPVTFYDAILPNGTPVAPYTVNWSDGVSLGVYLNPECDANPRCDTFPPTQSLACNDGVLYNLETGKVVTDTHHFFGGCNECTAEWGCVDSCPAKSGGSTGSGGSSAEKKSCAFTFYDAILPNGKPVAPYTVNWKDGTRLNVYLNPECDANPRCDTNPPQVNISCNDGVLSYTDSGKVITDTHHFFGGCNQCTQEFGCFDSCPAKSGGSSGGSGGSGGSSGGSSGAGNGSSGSSGSTSGTMSGRPNIPIKVMPTAPDATSSVAQGSKKKKHWWVKFTENIGMRKKNKGAPVAVAPLPATESSATASTPLPKTTGDSMSKKSSKKVNKKECKEEKIESVKDGVMTLKKTKCD